MAELTVNGRALQIDESRLDPHTTVLDFLRDRGLVGTKEGCAEGECGACAVVIVRANHNNQTAFVPVNSCLTLLGSVLGGELISVEGVRPSPEALHPVQAAMVEHGGSQCGYCTPGFVVSMFAEYYRRERPAWDPEAVAGNLCRCTGYRPIRDAMRSLGAPASDDRFLARLAQPAPRLGGLTQLRTRAGQPGQTPSKRQLLRPASLAELLEHLAEQPTAKLIAGGTDVVVEINQRQARWPTLISLEAVTELRSFTKTANVAQIGAGLNLSTLEHLLDHAVPLLDELFPLFSSRLIRNRATLGGNLANASPIGDSPPVLLALDAALELRSRAGSRVVPLADFFTGYRQTVLAAGELITKITVPLQRPTHAHFYKVSKRVLDDISTVAAAFALDVDPSSGEITKARLAYGGVAATPARAVAAEQALLGRPWTHQTLADVTPLLSAAFTPMSDHRGSADYRQAMCARLFQKFFHETTHNRRVGPQPPPVVTHAGAHHGGQP
ncbi:Xanthine dehydrogenase, iron-sulfur cluster and FAD-binding subunit A [Enhygromyxa salina]|uniref:Xanthine dehydrogenase, iron-sulfur cluster and FAD-binding subunit A n=1 Tax=Enhygromyxa salina TaxID=215803 RepID=A0A0C1ZSR6_9BACT|nr:xanthine dehydrogenase small subunit [Enhygromyxa salina]KIG14108.1 Xanthine dehydrogenase, iron-sulfur cluster and FAD-binding subunit A [Enhygromyxa salina]